VIGQFLRFGVVGTLGFVVDTATVYALWARLGPVGAGVVAYVVAASANWALNRVWTFRSSAPPGRQWVLFLAANLVGFVLNRGLYIFLVLNVLLAATYPVLAVAAGSLAGMFVNFGLSRKIFLGN